MRRGGRSPQTPSIEQLVMVELERKVVEIAKEHFGTIHHGVFDNPKL